LVLPHLTFQDGEVSLRVGKKTLNLFPLPGHSADNLAILVEEDRVLFAGDTAMSLPYLVDGDVDDTVASFKKISKLGLENIVQGHGAIILRGEIENYVKENLAYISNIRKVVRKANRRKYPQEVLDAATVESCGKSRVLIGGLAAELHRRNLRALYRQMFGQLPVFTDEFDDDYEDDEFDEEE
jgi:glyoxylase-like metal-dependent hydrolase (beta-lactamase superfamily II)